MEGDWEGPGRGTEYRPGTYDNPWNIRYPKISQADPVAGKELPDSVSGCTLVFDAESASCYCNNQTVEITVTGTWPINALTLTWFAVGTSLTVLDGLGTNTVTAELTTTDNQSGYVTIEASMTAYCDGKAFPGDSNVNLFECRECCPAECDLVVNSTTTPDTIAQDASATIGVTGGTAPFTWALTQPNGSGFTIDASTEATTTLYTTAIACGSAVLTVTDSCGCVVTFGVRCTTGSWTSDGTGPTKCNGCAGPPYCDDSRGSGWVGSIPQKQCYPPNCQYYFEETLRRTRADSNSYRNGSYPDAQATCNAALAATTCSGSDCTFYGIGGMLCQECVGHMDTWTTFQSGSSPVVPYNLSSPPALYIIDECVLNPRAPGRWAYGWLCYQSIGLTRFKWTC